METEFTSVPVSILDALLIYRFQPFYEHRVVIVFTNKFSTLPRYIWPSASQALNQLQAFDKFTNIARSEQELLILR